MGWLRATSRLPHRAWMARALFGLERVVTSGGQRGLLRLLAFALLLSGALMPVSATPDLRASAVVQRVSAARPQIPGPHGPRMLPRAALATHPLATAPGVLWRVAPTTLPLLAVPTAGPDGTLYAAAGNGVLYALAPDGRLRWSFPTGITGRLPRPAVGADSSSYWTLPGGVVAINARGQVRWVFLTPAAGAPIVDHNRLLVATQTDLEAIALSGRHAGQLLWRAAIGGAAHSGAADTVTGGSLGPAPVVASNGTAYVVTAAGDLDAVGPDGLRRWRVQLGLPLPFRPALGRDGTVYLDAFANGQGTLFALTPRGQLRWQRAVPTGSDVTVGSDGTIYVAAFQLVALSPAGQVRWQRIVDGAAPPVETSDGLTLVATLRPAGLIALDARGQVQWQVSLPAPLIGPPAPGLHGQIYGGDATGVLLALAPGARGAGRLLTVKTPAGPAADLGASNTPFQVQSGRVAWRVTLAQTVERRLGSGSWQTVLAPGRATPDPRTGRVLPARYATVSFLMLDQHRTGLYVGTVGTVGNYLAAGAGASVGGLLYSPNGTSGWQLRVQGLSFTDEPRLRVATYGLASIVVDPAQQGALYAQTLAGFGAPAHDAGLYRSTDGGLQWVQATQGLQAVPQGNPLLGYYRAYPPGTLLLDRARAGLLFLVAPTGLYRSVDGARQWDLVRGVAYDDPVSVAVRIEGAGVVRVFTDRGLYLSTDFGAHWRRLQGGQAHTLQLTLSQTAPPPYEFLVQPDSTPTSPPPPPPSATASTTPSATATATATPSPTATATPTPSTIASATLSPPSPTATTVAAPVATTTNTATPTPTSTAAVPTPTMTATATITSTATVTMTAIATVTSTATVAATSSVSATMTSTATATTTVTATVTITQTATATATITPTASATMTPTVTMTPTSTAMPSATLTSSATPTPSPTTTPSATPTSSATATSSPTASNTPSPTPTATTTPVPITGILPPGWTWTQLASNGAAGSPPPRQDATVVWDPSDRQLLLYGGTNTFSSVAMSDLWAYSPALNGWRRLASAGTGPLPAGRFGAAGVWDAIDRRLLIFGGQQGIGAGARLLDDVEAYSPASNTWTTLSPQGQPGAPSPRSRTGAAWDSSAGRLLIFGGETSDAPLGLSNQLWAFSPAQGAWTLLAPVAGQDNPPARNWPAAAWDPAAGVLRLFSGKNAAGAAFSDTWEWSAVGGWRFDETRTQPEGRAAAAAVWDVQHTHFLIGPGLDLTGDATDTWAFSTAGRTWLRQNVLGAAPPARQMTAMVWDDAAGQGLLFGGRIAGSGASNDLWALRPIASAAGPTTNPASPVQLAVDVGLVVSADGKLLATPQEVKAAAAARVSLVRFAFDVGNSPGWTPALLLTYGRAIALFRRAGIGVIGLVGPGATTDPVQADWTANNEENSGGSGDNPFISALYTAALRTLVRSFHGPPYNVKIWELWNEPNVSTTCSGSVCAGATFLYPSNFAALLADSYQAVKGAGGLTDVTLLSGGLYGQSASGAYTAANSGAPYLTATYHMGVDVIGNWKTIKAQTGSYPLDAVGQHIYIDQAGYTSPATIRAYHDWLRGAYTAYEGTTTRKPTIVTEEGWTTGASPGVPGVTLAQQLDNVDAAYWAAKDVDYVPIVTWFQLQDNPAANLHYGLYTSTWVAKPARTRLQSQYEFRAAR